MITNIIAGQFDSSDGVMTLLAGSTEFVFNFVTRYKILTNSVHL